MVLHSSWSSLLEEDTSSKNVSSLWLVYPLLDTVRRYLLQNKLLRRALLWWLQLNSRTQTQWSIGLVRRSIWLDFAVRIWSGGIVKFFGSSRARPLFVCCTSWLVRTYSARVQLGRAKFSFDVGVGCDGQLAKDFGGSLQHWWWRRRRCFTICNKVESCRRIV